MNWSDKDLQQIKAHHIQESEADRQMNIFKNPPPPLNIDRPCTPEDGILILSDAEKAELRNHFDNAAAQGRISRFVPASGAASRMFKDLFDSCTPLLEWHQGGDCPSSAFHKEFFTGLSRFAFYPALSECLKGKGYNLDDLTMSRDLSAAVKGLLEPWGLDYAQRPKGLLDFHRYPEGARSPLEEHLVEAASLHAHAKGPCRLHFTVSPEFMDEFKLSAHRAAEAFSKRFDLEFAISFSCQEASTDTLAVTENNLPFRSATGELVFRPAGHGALLKNLGDTAEDLVLIKNIDNVVPEHLQPAVTDWWKLLGGKLAELDQTAKKLLDGLRNNPNQALLDQGCSFLKSRFQQEPTNADQDIHSWLEDRLDRPMRVCGMVRNLGEPGGGPYWVRHPDGCSAQIVEMAQIPEDDPTAQKAVAEATHFNPVLMACSLRSAEGKPHSLERFIDQNAIIVSEKSMGGTVLKALERPGLWNGAMAGWNTLFIEVPVEIFQPVKTVVDLLRPGHQPAPD